MFADALDLRTAVVETVGNASIADVWPRIVALAELKLNQKLRTRYQLTEAALTLPSALPADYLETAGYYQNGKRVTWSITNDLTAGDYTLSYYASIPTIANSLTATNWLLQRYPDVYLYSVAVEAAKHLRDLDAVGALQALMDRAVMDLFIDDERARYGGAVIRVKGATP